MAATYEFQPPPNLAAIRYTIGKHIQKQRAKPCEHDSPPPTDSPSLPTETETQDNLTMPQADLDKDTIIQKIKDLQEEKHKLFGLMRTLLAAPCKEKKQPLPLTSDPASAQKSADETKTEERKRNPPQGRLPPPPAGSPILIMPSSAPKHYMVLY
ncbi:hypothetical protein DFQ30_005268 [Apophysomyces sp. BC1015]|nr:hypothetical protein DFQ30_005268 [Apophysomyces sp. BC1015]